MKFALSPEAEAWLQGLLDSGRKKSTVRSYENNLCQCMYHLDKAGRSTKAEDITPDDVVYLWGALAVKETVRQSYLRTLAMFTIKMCGRDVVKQADILRNREVRDRVFITKQEYRRMWDVANPQERMILTLGGMMGLRRNEMVNLKDDDIRDGMAVIHGKGHGADGLVIKMPIPKMVMEEIERYRKFKSQYENSGDGYLLQSFNRKGKLSQCNSSRVSDLVCKLGRSVGVRATTHSLRRLYATLLFYESKADPQTVRVLMRHADMSTTFKCYIDACDKNARAAVNNLMGIMEDLIDDDPKPKKRGRGKKPASEPAGVNRT